MDSKIWKCARKVSEASLYGVWRMMLSLPAPQHHTPEDSFEFMQRKDNGKDYCPVSQSVISRCATVENVASFSFYLLTYFSFFPTKKILTAFWLRHMTSWGSCVSEGSV